MMLGHQQQAREHLVVGGYSEYNPGFFRAASKIS